MQGRVCLFVRRSVCSHLSVFQGEIDDIQGNLLSALDGRRRMGGKGARGSDKITIRMEKSLHVAGWGNGYKKLGKIGSDIWRLQGNCCGLGVISLFIADGGTRWQMET